MTEQAPESSIEYHQRRGAAWDVVDEAILSYEAWLLKDDFDSLTVLTEIINKMKERRALYGERQKR